MRRSQMIEVLRSSFIKHMSSVDCCASNEVMYSHVLRDLEEAGMKPPVVSGKRMPIGYDGNTCEVAAWDVSGRPVNAWEPE